MSVRSGQPGINGNEYSLLPLSLPTIKEQDKIVDLLSSLTITIHSHLNELELLKKQKKGLMQKLLTGVIRVKV